MDPNSDIMLLISLLYKADLTRINECRFKEIIYKAAEDTAILERFKRYPQYQFSKVLDETLLALVMGGMIVGEGLGCFAVRSRSLEIYGEVNFNKLTINEKEVVERVAKLIHDQCRAV